MKNKLLLLISLFVGCIPIDKIETDYERGWFIEADGTRHFYGRGEVVLNQEIRCLIHGVDETITLKKGLTPKEKK